MKKVKTTHILGAIAGAIVLAFLAKQQSKKKEKPLEPTPLRKTEWDS